MRLFEVTDHFIDDLTTELRNMRGTSDSEHGTRTLTWPAFNNIAVSFGYSKMNTKSLAELVKNNPSLSKVIKTFDDKAIILKTEEEEAQEPTEIPAGPSVDQMARSASQDYQSKLANLG